MVLRMIEETSKQKVNLTNFYIDAEQKKKNY